MHYLIRIQLTHKDSDLQGNINSKIRRAFGDKNQQFGIVQSTASVTAKGGGQ